MRIKKLLFILFCVSFAGANGQSSNVQSAANELKDRRYAKAKQYIDLAAANEKTANDPKMWYYRGEVYLAIYRDTGELGKSEPDAAEKAAISYMNTIKTDKGNYHVEDAYNQVWICGVALFKKAQMAYESGDLERATRFYKFIFDIIPLDKENNLKRNNITPESLNRNLFLVASKAKDNVKAKEYLQKLMDAKFSDPLIYIYMSNIYLEEKDTAKALTYIDMGRNRFEDNQKLIDEEIRIYFAQGKIDVLIEKLTTAIEASPDNDALYFTRATLYGKRNETDKAIADYKQALEIRPDNFDANYNLGVVYFNKGANMLNAASSIKNADEYAKTKEKAEGVFNQAQPYFEKAHEINPKDIDVMTLLKQLYFRQNNMDKYNKIKGEMEAAASGK